MKRMELEVYSDASNFGILRMPGRKFPACAIQGDSLCILFQQAQDVLSQLKSRGAVQETVDAAAEIVELLGARLDHYEAVLSEHGIELPYGRRTKG